MENRSSRSPDWILAIMLVLASALLFYTNGIFTRWEAIAFYILVALITGTAFWRISPSEGMLFERPGIRLTGSAAIGAGFMTIAAGLQSVFPSEPLVIFPLPDDVEMKAVVEGVNGASVWHVRDRGVLVEFGEGGSEEDVRIRWVEGGEVREALFTADRRSGRLVRQDS